MSLILISLLSIVKFIRSLLAIVMVVKANQRPIHRSKMSIRWSGGHLAALIQVKHTDLSDTERYTDPLKFHYWKSLFHIVFEDSAVVQVN